MHQLNGHVFIINLQSVICKVLAQLVKLRYHFLDYPFKKICLDNAGEFTSYVFHAKIDL